MNMLNLSLIVCLILGAIGGCATRPTVEQFSNADYGAPMDEARARAIAKQAISSLLKDPQSARFTWGELRKGYVSNGWFYGGGFLYGYLLDVHVNARNSFGGYVGNRLYQFLFHDGKIVAALGETTLKGGRTYMNRLK